jgi:proliferating cell nuclear antigen
MLKSETEVGPKGSHSMFQAKVKAEVLKTVLDAVQTLVDEARIVVTAEGISLKAVDPAHVAMVELSLGKRAFESYKGGDVEMGVDLDKLKDILKLASSGDIIGLDYKEDSHKLVFKIGHITRRMALVDTSSMNEPKVPNLNLPCKVTLTAGELQQGIKASEAVSDHIALSANGDAFELSAEGDTDQVHLSLSGDDLIKIESPEPARSLFSLDYLANMSKVVKGSDPVTLNLGTDYPVKIEFDIADGAGHITYLLAPRIESE